MTNLYSIGALALSFYGFLNIVINQYETFNMDKSMLKKMYSEIIDDEPCSAFDDLTKITDES